MHNDELLDTTAVAELLGLKPDTVRWYHKKKARGTMLPPADQFFGRSPVWKRSTIEEWDAARRTVTRVDISPSK
jgi:predicted DNA-binding transcriptional regulator AlpA